MPRSVAVSAMAGIISRARVRVQPSSVQRRMRGLVLATVAPRRGLYEGRVMTAVGVDALLSLFPPGSALDPDGMLTIAGCRADALATEFDTPVLVVSERALRARAREYADGLAARWPRSRVVFASKAFPCTAVQRVMVEEGLGLDVAGGGEIVTALKAGVDPALLVLHGNAKGDDEIAMAAEHGIGLVVVDNGDDVDRLEATGREHDVLVRVIPGVDGRHARARAHRPRGVEVRARPGRRRGADPADRAQPAAAHAGAARPRRLADPRRRAVRAVGRAGRRARRVPGLRPRRRPRRALQLRRPRRRPSASTSTP